MSNLGNNVFNPDHPTNGLSSPAATVVSSMATAGVWFMEEGPISGTDTDVVNILCPDSGTQGLLIRMYRSLENQRLMSNFSFAMIHDGTNSVLRCFPRQLVTYMSLENAMKNSGIPVSGFPSEDWQGTGMTSYLTSLNDSLKPHFITVYRA